MFVIETNRSEIYSDFEKLSLEKPVDNYSLDGLYTNNFLLDQETTRTERIPTAAVQSLRHFEAFQATPARTHCPLDTLNTLSCQNRKTEIPILGGNDEGAHQCSSVPAEEGEQLRSALKRKNEIWISADLIQNKTRTKYSSQKNGIKIIKQFTQSTGRPALGWRKQRRSQPRQLQSKS